MNSIHGFLRRILPNRRNLNRDEFSFELLRSASARELKKRNNNSKQPLMWPRPASNHEHLHINAPKLNSEDMIEVLGENGEGVRNDETALLGFIENSMDAHTSSPTCSSYGVDLSSEESPLDRAISECNVIRANPYFSEGVLLKCVDAKRKIFTIYRQDRSGFQRDALNVYEMQTSSLYTYLHYALFKNPDHDMRVAQVGEVIRELHVRPKSQFGAYDEIYVIQKASSMVDSKLPSHRHAGYIAVLFKLLDEQTRHESLEKSWLSWSGAREIYKYAPRSWNLRRIALHKLPKSRKTIHRPFAYVLMCEFGSIFHPSNRLKALDMVERLRVRNCGYISLYQVHWSYGRITSSPEASTSFSQESPASIGRRDRNPMLRGFSQEIEPTEISRHRSPKSHNRVGRSIGPYDEEGPVFHSYHHFTDFG